MNFVNSDPTFAEQADSVRGLYQQIADIRDRYAAGDTDARHVNLNNIMMAANAAIATLRLMQWAKVGGDGLLIQALGLAKPGYINPVTEDLLRSSRLFLLVEAQFQIEALFKNILLALGKPVPMQGFYNIAENVLAAASIADLASKLQILNVPALMRNSMHANGIHRGWKSRDTVVVMKTVEVRFEHNKRVQCGSWYHIVTALSATFEVVDEILGSPVVGALKSIPDEYAAQASAGP